MECAETTFFNIPSSENASTHTHTRNRTISIRFVFGTALQCQLQLLSFATHLITENGLATPAHTNNEL